MMDQQQIRSPIARDEFRKPSPWVQSKHVGIAVLILVCMVMATLLLVLPTKAQLVPVLLLPAAFVCFLILRNPFVGVYLYFLYTFLRPYDFIPALIPFRLNMVIEIVTLVSWIIALVQTKDRIKWSDFNWFYVGFLFVLGLGIPFAAIGPRAFDAWQTVAIYFVMLVVATNVADSVPRIRKLIWLMLLIHFYFALRGIYNYNFAPTIYASGERTSGIVGSSFLADENDFALAINLMIPFAFFIFEHARTAYRKFFGAAFLVTYALGVVSSFSRGGWVGLMAVTIFCVVSSKRRAKSAVAVLLVGVAMLMFAPSSYWREMETVTDVNESTADERIRSWEAAFRIFLDYPIIGVGGANAGVHLPNYIQGTTDTARMWGRAVHGTFPEVLADTGALGTAMYLLMMFYVLKYMIRIRQRPPPSAGKGLTMPILATAMIGSIIAYVVTATFLSTAYYPQLWTLYTFALMLYFVYQSRMDKRHRDEEQVAATHLPESQSAN